jgi:hypothetical protein
MLQRDIGIVYLMSTTSANQKLVVPGPCTDKLDSQVSDRYVASYQWRIQLTNAVLQPHVDLNNLLTVLGTVYVLHTTCNLQPNFIFNILSLACKAHEKWHACPKHTCSYARRHMGRLFAAYSVFSKQQTMCK